MGIGRCKYSVKMLHLLAGGHVLVNYLVRVSGVT